MEERWRRRRLYGGAERLQKYSASWSERRVTRKAALQLYRRVIAAIRISPDAHRMSVVVELVFCEMFFFLLFLLLLIGSPKAHCDGK